MTGAKGARTRDKLVDATAALLERQGYHATGLAEIVAASGAPRGSLYFHFPGGKDELARLALEASSARWRAKIDAIVDAAPDLGTAVYDVCVALADELAASHYEHGCPVAAVALEAAATSGEIRRAVAAHSAAWQDALARRVGGARDLATLVLAAIEGAHVLAKVQRSREPLLAVGRMLRALGASGSPPTRSRDAGARGSSRRRTRTRTPGPARTRRRSTRAARRR
jgi:TetR/AcrR family transcriptional repressor of lmrAB and yxaGH operons